MDGTDFSGKSLTSYSLYNEGRQDKAEATCSEEEVKLSISRSGSVKSKPRDLAAIPDKLILVNDTNGLRGSSYFHNRRLWVHLLPHSMNYQF